MIRITYDITGEARKKLVKAIAEATGFEAKYMRAPSMAYQIGPYTVTKDGTVEVDENEPTLDAAINAGVLAGFIGCVEAPETVERGAINIPRTDLTDPQIENLKKIVAGKEDLIKKAFDVEDPSIEVGDEWISFRWFDTRTHDNFPVYATFVTALVNMARQAKRVSMTNKPVENEKYAWRCFLLRLGFIGEEFKQCRKVLLSNFSGSSAFKNK